MYNYLEENTPVFLLSHAHSDHLAGLNSKWKKGNIYCTYITKIIIQKIFKLDNDLFV